MTKTTINERLLMFLNEKQENKVKAEYSLEIIHVYLYNTPMLGEELII